MFSPESIHAAKSLTLPDTEDVYEITDYDRKIWQDVFDWYNKTFSPEHNYSLSCRACYSKVFNALKKAQAL